MHQKLDTIERELREATAAARTAGMSATSTVAVVEMPAWLTAPPRRRPPVLLPPRSSASADDMRAEGSGYEILLQVFLPVLMSPLSGTQFRSPSRAPLQSLPHRLARLGRR